MNSPRLCIGFWACLILSYVAPGFWLRGLYLLLAFVLLALDLWPERQKGREGFWKKVWRR